jgi:hypothetical protein
MNALKSFKRTLHLCLKRRRVARWTWIVLFNFNLFASIGQANAQAAETYMMDVENETKASQQRTTEERTTVVRRRSLDERANFCCS